jgi:hypothetical protein
MCHSGLDPESILQTDTHFEGSMLKQVQHDSRQIILIIKSLK